MEERKIIIGRGGILTLLVAGVVMMVFFIATCGIVMADEPPDATPLMQGQPAPFDGVLLPPETLEGLLTDKAEAARLGAELKATQKELDLTTRLYEDRVRKLTGQLDPGFWRQPEIQRWVGFGLGVIFTSGAVWGAGQLE